MSAFKFIILKLDEIVQRLSQNSYSIKLFLYIRRGTIYDYCMVLNLTTIKCYFALPYTYTVALLEANT